jgi:outer membrane protein OmpA-like peptidoglycan-associated protein
MWCFARQRNPHQDDDLNTHRARGRAESLGTSDSMLHLQRTAGNRAAQRMVAALAQVPLRVVALESFAGNKAELTERDRLKLNDVAGELKRASGCRQALITWFAGPADTAGAVELGRRRAAMVRAYLESMGVPGSLLRTRERQVSQSAGSQVELAILEAGKSGMRP